MSNPEDLGLILYPGNINSTQTLWVRNTGILRANVSSAVIFTPTPQAFTLTSVPQTVSLTSFTPTSDSTLFSLVGGVVTCLQSGIYSFQSYITIQSSLGATAVAPTIRLAVNLFDSLGTVLLPSFVSYVYVNSLGGFYTINCSGTCPIYTGQSVRLSFIDATGAVSGLCSSLSQDIGVGQRGNTNISFTLLSALEPLPEAVVAPAPVRRYRVPQMQRNVVRTSTPAAGLRSISPLALRQAKFSK